MKTNRQQRTACARGVSSCSCGAPRNHHHHHHFFLLYDPGIILLVILVGPTSGHAESQQRSTPTYRCPTTRRSIPWGKTEYIPSWNHKGGMKRDSRRSPLNLHTFNDIFHDGSMIWTVNKREIVALVFFKSMKIKSEWSQQLLCRYIETFWEIQTPGLLTRRRWECPMGSSARGSRRNADVILLKSQTIPLGRFIRSFVSRNPRSGPNLRPIHKILHCNTRGDRKISIARKRSPIILSRGSYLKHIYIELRRSLFCTLRNLNIAQN